MLQIKNKIFEGATKSRARLVFFIAVALLLYFVVGPKKSFAQFVEGSPQTFPYKQKFIVSSYYSPLPNQSFYFRGTYEAEVRLNGEGVHAADGTLVYPGMAAAPKTFPFGTKLEIPGFGIVAVHDRGGAIKNNRLDIWVGEGEEGLRRALGWGMRTLEVTVYGVDPNIKESVNFSSVPQANLASILPKTQHFKSDLAYGDSGDAVLEMQRFLKKLGYFDFEPTGFFAEETQKAVEKFQVSHGVIASSEDPAAGNFGPRSRVKLEEVLEAKAQEARLKLSAATLKRGDSGDAVKRLQEVLTEYGFLKETTGTFDEKTFDALTRFQLDTQVIATPKDRGAGFYGPKTRAAFMTAIETRFTPRLGRLIQPSQQKSVSEQVFSASLSRESRGEEVERLQEELFRLHFLALKPTGYYGTFTEHSVYKFQEAFGIVDSEKSEGAGLVGPKTLEKLNEIASQRFQQKRLIALTTENKTIVAQRVEEEKSLLASADVGGLFGTTLVYGSRGNDVTRLQKTLKQLGFFPGRLTTEYFGDITKQSLSSFQKDHSLTETGVLDEATRKLLNRMVKPA